MTLSIAMTSYLRAPLLDNTLRSIKMQTVKPDQIIVVEDGDDPGNATRDVCNKWVGEGLPVEFYRRLNRPKLGYSNPAIPKNIGIRKATGDFLIIQCAEVMYTLATDIDSMMRIFREKPNDRIAAYATVTSRLDDGGFKEWYCGPKRAEKWFLDFCVMMRRQEAVAIGGFDEGYEGYGFDDDDFTERLKHNGMSFQWVTEVECHHQHHEIIAKDRLLSQAGELRLSVTRHELSIGKRTPVANIGINWGDINS